MDFLDPRASSKPKLGAKPATTLQPVQAARSAQPALQFVVQRDGDQAFLGNDNHPAHSAEHAQTFDSEGVAGVWASKANRMHPGTWKAVPAPVETPEDDELEAA